MLATMHAKVVLVEIVVIELMYLVLAWAQCLSWSVLPGDVYS